MEGKGKLFVTLFWGVIAILVAYILGQSYASRTKKLQRTVQVTGYAERSFKSDQASWTAEFTRYSEKLQDASSALKQDAEVIYNFLKEKGFKQEEISFSAVDITKEYDYVDCEDKGSVKSKFKGYRLFQKVTIQSNNVEAVDNISREISDLIEKGVEITSYPPLYYYSKLNELKLELIAEASKNARDRAQKICEQTGGKVKKPLSVKIGVFQITNKNSNPEYSWEGVYDLEAKEKNATITVKVEFEIR
ncbi:MAG: SIMPL domain-containing protein [Bacteroidales bacterium]|nr:SIMPL domain-containing protein [Bacteroidales bacterium]